MSNFGHVEKITREIGGKVCTFRCKMEARWAHWCQLRKEQGFIADWWYEDPDSTMELEVLYNKNKKVYRPDFTIQRDGGFEIEETKGYFPPAAYTKLFLASRQYDTPITLIFARPPASPHSRSKSCLDQQARAQKLEPHIKRIIWDADKTIFTKINYLFDF